MRCGEELLHFGGIMTNAIGGKTFTHEGLLFRDLDHDGVLAPFEDWRLSAQERATDLLSRLSIEEKVGLMLHGTLRAPGPYGMAGVGETYDFDEARVKILSRKVVAAISRLGVNPSQLAAHHNELQNIASEGRFSIPLSISTDPRNHFSSIVGVSQQSEGFSRFPEFLGLGATNDVDLVRAVGDVVRREYRAVGFHTALSPQADLATEPRWSRALGTFGSNPSRVSVLCGAYIEGVQGGAVGLTKDSVACVVKHWVGYGASRDGFDGHNYYGRFSAFPGGRFQDHVDAFEGAFAANVAGVMPTYNILEGLELYGQLVEQTGAGFSHTVLTRLLRGDYHFDGVILSDWAITANASEATKTGNPPQGPRDIAMPWGVEDLSRSDRFALAINAGIDQIGGEEDPTPLLEALDKGLINGERVNEAAHRVLVEKFALGLFENPYVDVEAAGGIVGSSEWHDLAYQTQRKSLVSFTPLTRTLSTSDKVFVEGVNADVVTAKGFTVTSSIEDATVAVMRLQAPFEVLHPTFFFGNMMHEGSLTYAEDDLQIAKLRELSAKVATIAVVFADRPPTIGVLDELATSVIAEYGASDEVILDALSDGQGIVGTSPMHRPASMQAVEDHNCDDFEGWN
jgi:beta-glucosidase